MEELIQSIDKLTDKLECLIQILLSRENSLAGIHEDIHSILNSLENIRYCGSLKNEDTQT